MCEQISVFGSCVFSSPFSKEALNCLIIQWGLVHSSWQRRSHVLNMTTSFCCRGVDRQDAAMLWAPHIRVALLHISQLTRIMKAMQRQIYWRLVLLDKCNSFCSFWKLLLKGLGLEFLDFCCCAHQMVRTESYSWKPCLFIFGQSTESLTKQDTVRAVGIAYQDIHPCWIMGNHNGKDSHVPTGNSASNSPISKHIREIIYKILCISFRLCILFFCNCLVSSDHYF